MSEPMDTESSASAAPGLPAWTAGFAMLHGADDAVLRRILTHARTVSAPPGAVLFRHGDRCQQYMLVLDGSVRVQKASESGREIVLYRVESGEACVLTTSCLLSRESYPAEGVAETAVRAIAIPVQYFQEGLASSAAFRAFVFASYGRRIAELIALVEEVAFGRVDVRLAQRLREHGARAGSLAHTHQELACELGTAREVVSRQLKEFERRGWVRLHRGRIDILDLAALQSLEERA
jgi:CRP/FNR family transcriptional regulator, anaerobic regulatory protein